MPLAATLQHLTTTNFDMCRQDCDLDSICFKANESHELHSGLSRFVRFLKCLLSADYVSLGGMIRNKLSTLSMVFLYTVIATLPAIQTQFRMNAAQKKKLFSWHWQLATCNLAKRRILMFFLEDWASIERMLSTFEGLFQEDINKCASKVLGTLEE